MDDTSSFGFRPELIAKAHPDVQKIMRTIPDAIIHAENTVRFFDHSFTLHRPDARPVDPRQALNQYIDATFACSMSKFASINRSMIESANRHDFLAYALTGRSMIEITATLRYYFLQKIMPIINKCHPKSQISIGEFHQLTGLFHRYLLGSRFDWETYFTKGFTQLTQDYADWLDKKQRIKNAKRWEAKPLGSEQIRVGPCLEFWAKKDARIGVLYDLFCDMVHPNAGSTLCVAEITEAGAKFNPRSEHSVGLSLFAGSYGPLQVLVGNEFARVIEWLPQLKYLPDELP